MSRPCFLLPSIRPDLMRALLNSWDARPWRDDYQMACALIDYSDAEYEEVRDRLGDRALLILRIEGRTPPFPLRQRILDELPAWPDEFIFLDDDMEFTDETNFAGALAKVRSDPGCGIVSCNWVRSEAPGLRAKARYEETFIKQPLVNMAGGQVMRAEIARLIQNHDRIPYTFCDVQKALIAYVNGFVNYRYLGSILIHRILESEGLKKSYKVMPFSAPDPAYIEAKPCKAVYAFEGQNYYMPASKDLTDHAHAEHNRARAARFG